MTVLSERDLQPYRELVCSVIRQAVQDLSFRSSPSDMPPRGRGQLSYESLSEFERRIRAEASEWLKGPDCQNWCEFLGIDHKAVVERVKEGKP